MMRYLSGWTVLLALAIILVIGLLVTRNQAPPIDDPVGDAVKQISEQLGMDVDPSAQGGEGVAVLSVKPGSPAAQLGLQKGDLIRAVGDRTVWHAKELADQLSSSLQRGGASLLVENNGVFRQVILGGVRQQAGAAGGPAGAPAGRGGGPAAAPAGRGATRGPGASPAQGR